MAFKGDATKLVGDDAYLKKVAFGSEIAGDNSTPLPAPGVYMVTKVAVSSNFPATALGGTGIAPGDILILATGDSLVPNINDNVVTLNLTDQCDVQNWGMEFSRNEIDVTTVCDIINVYRAGKSDMTGTISGIFVVGTSDAIDGKFRKFMDIAKQDEVSSFDRFPQEDEIGLGFFYMNHDPNIADIMYIVAPYQIYGSAAGGEIGSAQTFSTSFRFGNISYTSTLSGVTIPIRPTLYRLGSA